MKKTLLAGFALVAVTFASCNATHEEKTLTTGETTTVLDPVTGKIETVAAQSQTTTTTTHSERGPVVHQDPTPKPGDTILVLDPATGKAQNVVAH